VVSRRTLPGAPPAASGTGVNGHGTLDLDRCDHLRTGQLARGPVHGDRGPHGPLPPAAARHRRPIRNRRVNERTGREVPSENIVKGYELAEGEYIVVEPDELDQIAPGRSQTIDITGSSRAVSATALLRDSAPDGLPEALSGLHINPRSQPANTALPRAA
jgi:hypothetical protein